jgi:hypothetical protein
MLARDDVVFLDAARLTGSRGVAWAECVLREQEMPVDELRIVLSNADRELVRRYLDLHLERLDERLASQKRRIEAVGRILAGPRGRRAAPLEVRPARRGEAC